MGAVWSRDAWLDILGRFIHVEKPSKGSRARPTVIFPRFHQWDVVRRLEADAKASGGGRNYLVQHSAGSGKSNSIAWLAHRFSSLHDSEDRKVFDKVVVITDRLILDRQLQDTISQFEHAIGVVQRIDESSSQLAEALVGEQARIIVTTLQKFRFCSTRSRRCRTALMRWLWMRPIRRRRERQRRELRRVLWFCRCWGGRRRDRC